MIAELHPEDIKAMIRKRGMTLEALSAQLGYSRVAVGIALRRPWPAVQSGIASFLGVEPTDLWPSRYAAGSAQSNRGRADKLDRSRAAEPRLRQKNKVA